MIDWFHSTSPPTIFRSACIVAGACCVLSVGPLSGCGRRTPESVGLSPLPKDAVVLSYISGMNPMKELYQERSTGSVLQDVLDRRVVHAGVQEEFSKEALERLPGVLAKVKPALVILGYGMTDIRRQRDTDELKATLEAMIRLAREHDAEVAMIAMPGAGFSMKPHSLYAELAKDLGVPTEMNIAFELMRTHAMKGEKWTLNDAGVRRLAEAIHDMLVESGAL